jgi:hypothetical protein
MALTTFYYSDRGPTTSSDTIITSSSRPAVTSLALIGVTIGDTVTSIANNAFDTCENLISVGFILPSVLTTIGYQAFADCYNLEEINLPDSVTTIGDEAFTGTNIDSFYVSANLITIGDTALSGGRFGNFIVDNNNPNYSNGSLGELFNKNKTTLIHYANKRIDNSYTIPDSVTTIGSGALQLSNNLTRINFTNNVTIITPYSVGNCANLTEVYIGKGLTNIGFNAFNSCTNLIKVIFIGNAPSSVGSDVFFNTNANLKVYRYSIRSGWSSTFGGKDVLLIDTVSKGLRTFGFPNFSSGKASIKKQNLGGGKIKINKLTNLFTCPFNINPITCPSVDPVDLSDSGWDLGPSLNFIETTTAPDNSNSAVIYQSTSAPNSYVSQGFLQYWRPFTRYKFSIWTKLIAGEAAEGNIMNITRNGGVDRVVLPAIGNLTSEWQKFSITFTTGGSVSSYVAAFFAENFNGGTQIAVWGAEMFRYD